MIAPSPWRGRGLRGFDLHGFSFLRWGAASVLAITIMAALGASYIAPAGYERQFREAPNTPPSAQHPLGTDDLGRDHLARLLQAARVSLLLAPLAAALATMLAALLGGMAGYLGGWTERCTLMVVDLFLSIPWLFLLISVRAALPLNLSPEKSVTVTFMLLGLLGWAASARVVCAGMRNLMASEFIWLARASGFSGARLVWLHLLPNLRGTLLAQFWISIPVFIVTEANLGALGLGVAEPLPSLGSLLRELQGTLTLHPSSVRFVPLLFLILVVSCFQILLNPSEVRA